MCPGGEGADLKSVGCNRLAGSNPVHGAIGVFGGSIRRRLKLSVGKIRCLYLIVQTILQAYATAVSSNRKISEQTHKIQRSTDQSTRRDDNPQKWIVVLGYCSVFIIYWPRHLRNNEYDICRCSTVVVQLIC